MAVVTLLATALIEMPPFTECPADEFAQEKERWFPAMMTVVQPWRGRHHVYGVFNLPVQYRRDRLYTARLMLRGFTEDFFEVSPEGGEINNGEVDHGHYTKRVYLPTRTALWFLFSGRFGDLKMPCHWRLIITERLS